MRVTERFRRLHHEGLLVLPNAWDIGSAVRLQRLGFQAIATTSSGHAASLGREDQQVTFEELCEHAAALVAAVDVPVTADSERLFADTPEGVAANVATLAATGVAGCSIEDYDPAAGVVVEVEEAARRVRAAAESAHEHGLVLTARAENHLYGHADLADTLTRLEAYRDAGADVLYAPGLVRREDIERVLGVADGVAVNVLLLPDAPPPRELAALGVRRVSTGGALARIAYDAAMRAAEELRP